MKNINRRRTVWNISVCFSSCENIKYLIKEVKELLGTETQKFHAYNAFLLFQNLNFSQRAILQKP